MEPSSLAELSRKRSQNAGTHAGSRPASQEPLWTGGGLSVRSVWVGEGVQFRDKKVFFCMGQVEKEKKSNNNNNNIL